MKHVALGLALAAPPVTIAAAAAQGGGAARPAAFARCAGCHSISRGGPSGVGPNLFGVAGRRAGVAPGFAYSPALRQSGVTWSRPALDRYLANPDTVARGGRMPRVNLTGAERQAVINYLVALR